MSLTIEDFEDWPENDPDADWWWFDTFEDEAE